MDTLAAGGNTLPAELAAHPQTCADCRAFCESQTVLFGYMDAGLLSIANPPVPPSFLPGVRARLEEQAASSANLFAGWRFAAAGAAAAIAISVGLLWHRPVVHPGHPQEAPVVSQTAGNATPAVRSPLVESPAVPRHSARRGIRAATSPEIAEAGPEVIVLPQEREAFARFVATLRVQPDAALALSRPAPARQDAAVEIALMDFGNVEVKPLESEAGE